VVQAALDGEQARAEQARLEQQRLEQARAAPPTTEEPLTEDPGTVPDAIDPDREVVPETSTEGDSVDPSFPSATVNLLPAELLPAEPPPVPPTVVQQPLVDQVPPSGDGGGTVRLGVIDRWRARRYRKWLAQQWADGATPGPRRTWRWVLATAIVALAIAVLFPLTVAAIRALVAL
jgi:hypothetical protein